ncbi:N-acetylmuramoyl-L-alanine amidase [Halobacillus yeomjeoni]|uniref:N-acetylmuramoyl-L-alanine amidase n=1 Tax=Halobacillus yeomjeoni TaxID=311194 RepID=A0A931MUW8_9BACI|nr:N-acetylmuramoyl-L-alanine amidase [Halobacillus yeomjeoni]MBH0229980.1 N-acetylmuramoyl-L-alanine amidase [Halobacillus yeomjeoni]
MRIKSLFFFIILFLTLLCGHTSSVQADEAIVKVDYLNVRTGPGINYERIGQVHSKQSYTIIEEKNNWLKINWKGQDAWVAKWLTTVKKEPVIQVKNFSSKVDYLRIRSDAGLHGSIKGYLMKNDTVEVQKRKGKWVRIEHNQVEGWVHSGYLVETKQETTPVSKDKKDETESKPAPSPEPSSVKGKVKVGTTILNVRSKGSIQGDILTQIKKGEVYDYIDEKNKWIHITLKNGKTGWVAGWLVNKVENDTVPSETSTKTSFVTLQYNGTNIRKGPSTGYEIVGRAGKGQDFQVIEKQGRWYKISFNGGEAFVAGWIVTEHTKKTNQPSSSIKGNLKGKTIMIDAGHGGRDPGAVGRAGTYEKTLTLKTAQKLKQKLESKGAEVLMTRDKDTYFSLALRTYYSKTASIDAFISIHYNSAPWHVIASGLNSYYYHSRDKSLAASIQAGMVSSTGFRDRGVQFGNYHVLRENRNPSVLLELGFVSNAKEEQIIRTETYQNQVVNGIAQGLINYYK